MALPWGLDPPGFEGMRWGHFEASPTPPPSLPPTGQQWALSSLDLNNKHHEIPDGNKQVSLGTAGSIFTGQKRSGSTCVEENSSDFVANRIALDAVCVWTRGQFSLLSLCVGLRVCLFLPSVSLGLSVTVFLRRCLSLSQNSL